MSVDWTVMQRDHSLKKTDAIICQTHLRGRVTISLQLQTWISQFRNLTYFTRLHTFAISQANDILNSQSILISSFAKRSCE